MQDALYHKFNFLSFVVFFDPDFLFGFFSGVSGFVVESVQILISLSEPLVFEISSSAPPSLSSDQSSSSAASIFGLNSWTRLLLLLLLRLLLLLLSFRCLVFHTPTPLFQSSPRVVHNRLILLLHSHFRCLISSDNSCWSSTSLINCVHLCFFSLAATLAETW